MSPQTKIERLPAGRVQCSLTFTPEEVATGELVALERAGQNMSFPGFRPGKAPIDMVRGRLKEEVLLEETTRSLLASNLHAILEEHKLQPILPPRVEIQARSPLTLSVIFVEYPEVTIKNPDKLRIEKKEAKANPKDIEKVIQSVLSEYQTATEVDEPSKHGQRITMSFSAKDTDGKDIPGLQAKGYSATLGDAHLLPGLEDQLLGLRKGEEKTFALTLPPKFAVAELQGKPVTFSVKMEKVENLTLPELTDEFAKKNLRADSAATFKTQVEESLTAQEEQMERIRRERVLLDAIRDQTQVELAPEILDDEKHSLIQDWQERLTQQGIEPEEWLKREGKTVKQWQEEIDKQASDRVRLRFGMAKLVKDRNVTVSTTEMKNAVESFLVRVPDEQQAQARSTLTPGTSQYAELEWRTTVEKLIEEQLKA